MAEVRKIGNYELLERIGQGGMGTVFKARQVSMDRIVALKILPPSLAKQATFTERFVREARASARLNHPHIVSGIDVGQDNGVYYFAMEFVDGLSVKDLLVKGKMNEQQVLKVAKAMAQALAHAHEHGILHRDIKPDNILVDKSGTPKLCDLGLARLDSQSEAEKALTQEGTALGTPHYISPEQARGLRDLDAKCDLYALGATLYHMLTGKTMYDGATHVVVMTKHVTEKCPHPTDAGAQASKGMVAVLAKLLTKDRADRYESAEKLAGDFDLVSQGKMPRFADLPPAKWPFTGGAQPPIPAKKAATTGPALPVEKSRSTSREKRPASTTEAPRWLVPVGLLGVVVLVLVLVLCLGKSRPQSAVANAAGANAPPPVKDRTTVVQPPTSPRVSAGGPPKPAATVASGARPASENRAAPRTDAPVPKKPEQLPVAVPPKTDMVGLAKPSEGEENGDKPPRPKAGTKPEPEASVASRPDTPVPKKVDDPGKTTPGPELAGLIAKAAALSAESKFGEAAALFNLPAAKLEQLDSFDRELAKLHADGYGGLAEIKGAIAARLKAEPNKLDATKVLSKMPSGTLAGADDRELFIEDKQVRTTRRWDKLSMEELYAVSTTTLGALPANMSLGLGVLAYDQNTEKDDAFARKALAGNTTAAAKSLLALIEARDKLTLLKKQLAQNAHAEKLLFELDEAMGNGKYAAVVAKATVLRTRYADTDAMRKRGAELDDLLEMAKAAQQTGALSQQGNVALASNGATCTGSSTAAKLIDGNTTEYDQGSGYAYVVFPGEFIITLPKVCLLRQMRLLLWDGELDRFYRYAIETSHDGQKYVLLVDRSKGQWRSWQQIDFTPRPVKTIKLKGVYNSSNPQFHAVELEAYCIPPDKPAKSKAARQGPPAPARPE
ncbi:MAG: protein kinase [Planctomycetota bacterium]|nr:protein kinase [Planctomycetota bacterium]